ncbi:MAG: transglycosylase SLT domain-containing protein [Nitrososphaerales archaeon]
MSAQHLTFHNQNFKASFAACPPSIATDNSSYDAWDNFIEQSCARHGLKDPWPMLVKSQCIQESAFDEYAVSSDLPCGDPVGWGKVSIMIRGQTKYVDEGNSFGAMQITPACGAAPDILLSNGHPNLTTDPTDPRWNTSVFNPQKNIDAGVSDLAQILSRMKSKYRSCSEVQYIKATLGVYNSGEEAISGCGSYNQRAESYISAVLGHYHVFARKANYPNLLGL